MGGFELYSRDHSKFCHICPFPAINFLRSGHDLAASGTHAQHRPLRAAATGWSFPSVPGGAARKHARLYPLRAPCVRRRGEHNERRWNPKVLAALVVSREVVSLAQVEATPPASRRSDHDAGNMASRTDSEIRPKDPRAGQSDREPIVGRLSTFMIGRPRPVLPQHRTVHLRALADRESV